MSGTVRDLVGTCCSASERGLCCYSLPVGPCHDCDALCSLLSLGVHSSSCGSYLSVTIYIQDVY